MKNDFLNNLPRVIVFQALNTIKDLKAARNTLNEVAGIYAIVCTVTGVVYIGSTINMGVRILDHFMDSSNLYLKNAINKHGVESFIFIVVELYEFNPELPVETNRELLLEREQYYLDELFKSPTEFRYNFLPTAGSSLGFKHSEETKVNISITRLGRRPTKQARKRISEAQQGINNPRYGKSAVNANTVYVYSFVDNQLVQTFPSQVAVAKWLNITERLLYE